VVPDGDWYLHLFDVTQPDLNWSNQEVRAEFLDILRFWLEIGLSGFRVDVANGLAKDPDYIDVGEITNFRDPIWLTVEHPFADRPELQEIVEGWRAVIDEYPGSILAAEAWVASWDRLVRYLRPGRHHNAFNFFVLELPWDAGLLRGGIDQAIRAFNSVGAYLGPFQPRRGSSRHSLCPSPGVGGS
jgi:alpha-glucosidase